jgi:hypothetical protein
MTVVSTKSEDQGGVSLAGGCHVIVLWPVKKEAGVIYLALIFSMRISPILTQPTRVHLGGIRVQGFEGFTG